MSESEKKSEFQTAAQGPEDGLIAEFIQFLKENKKWWLAILLVLLMMGALILLSGSAAAPFIYTLF